MQEKTMIQKQSCSKLCSKRTACGWSAFVQGVRLLTQRAHQKMAWVQYKIQESTAKMQTAIHSCFAGVRGKLGDCSGQGTTEYAILVGVLVVIAILAITVFRPKLQELWDAISDGINSL